MKYKRFHLQYKKVDQRKTQKSGTKYVLNNESEVVNVISLIRRKTYKEHFL